MRRLVFISNLESFTKSTLPAGILHRFGMNIKKGYPGPPGWGLGVTNPPLYIMTEVSVYKIHVVVAVDAEYFVICAFQVTMAEQPYYKIIKL